MISFEAAMQTLKTFVASVEDRRPCPMCGDSIGEHPIGFPPPFCTFDRQEAGEALDAMSERWAIGERE
jgi:hypothetical protein